MINPIGIFDSGIGGTSILKEVHQLLPHESIIYLADSKNAPYGDKSPEHILEFSIKNTEYLLNKGCKLIIIACNTATTNAIAYLRSRYEVPFVGIEPAIKPAALETRTGSIGILATKGTLSSSLFHKTSDLFAKHINVVEQTGEGIVSLIEAGQLDSQEMRSLLKTYIDPMIEANIDHLVLGCTHYPYLIPLLHELLPDGIEIIDSGLAVAKQTRHVLQSHHIGTKPNTAGEVHLITNGNPSILKSITQGKFQVNQENF